MVTTTGAALTWLVVSTAAAVAVSSATTIAMSGLPDGFNPAVTPAAAKPHGAVTPSSKRLTWWVIVMGTPPWWAARRPPAGPRQRWRPAALGRPRPWSGCRWRSWR